jgi:hypothetical protein
MHATATFELQNPTEAPLFADDLGGAPTGRRSFDKTFTGQIDGTSKVEMLAAGDPGGGGAGYVALELITATVGDRAGSFVLMHAGTMAPGSEPTASWTVVPGTGTGELTGIGGTGLIRFEDDGTHVFELDYELNP